LAYDASAESARQAHQAASPELLHRILDGLQRL
jgi:hypothetical protein